VSLFGATNGCVVIDVGFGVFGFQRGLGKEFVVRRHIDYIEILRCSVTFGTFWNSRFIVASSIKIGDADAIY